MSQHMPKDDNDFVIPTAKGFATQDASGTPKTSPWTVSSSELTITVPHNAAEMVICHTDNSLRVSEVTGMARYFIIPGNTGEVLQVAEGEAIYFKRDGASDCVVQFYFRTL